MAQIPLEKIRIALPVQNLSTLMEVLQQHGGTELIEETPTGTAVSAEKKLEQEATVHRASCEETLRFLSAYRNAPFLTKMFEGDRAHTTEHEMNTLEEKYPVKDILKKVTEFQQVFGTLLAEEKKVRDELRDIEDWRRLGLPLNRITDTQHATVVALRGSKKALSTLLAESENGSELDKHSDVFTVGETTALAIVYKPYRETFTRFIDSLGITLVTLPVSSETPEQMYETLLKKQEDVLQQKTDLEQAIAQYAKEHYTILQKHTEQARWKEARLHHATQTPRTTYTAVYTAWIPVTKKGALSTTLQEKIPESAYETVQTSAEEIPPTFLQNNSIVAPFQTVTTLYGAPVHQDLDPTPYLAPFFFVFFALCLGDVGYGLTLATLTGVILFKYHVETGMRAMLRLLFFGGIGSLVAGVFFGGYLGVAPGTIHPLLAQVQQFDPIGNPLPVFFLSLILGFIHVCFGIVLNTVRQFRLKEKKDALLDNMPWLYMFALAALFVLQSANLLPQQFATPLSIAFTPLVIAGVVVLILTQGRKKDGIFGKLFFGILSLYGAIGYFADILSYSRLLALGLATGALAFSINLIAGFVGNAVPFVGPVFLVLVLLFGHTLNITISVLGAFINSSRLQFVEFFSKFVTGTNRVFTPFCVSEHDIIILPEQGKKETTNI